MIMQRHNPYEAPKPHLERQLERKAMQLALTRGWYEIKIMKASRKGFPDRFLARDGRVLLIEFKRPGELDDTSRNQKKEHLALDAHGVEVHVIDSMEQVRELLY